jgi:uncharacterized protein YeaC (DUF1315 family)
MTSMTLKTKMNPEIKQKWVDALRSGKYDQGSEKLRSYQGYCCLGVLCDLYAQEQNVEWEFRGVDEDDRQVLEYWYFDGEGEFLPKSVREWAGLSISSPQVRVDVTEDDDEDDWFYNDDIANLNDTGYTFNDLAKMIQEQF